MKKTLDSGAVLEIQMAPFVEGEALLSAVMSELETVKIKLGADKFNNIQDLMCMDFGDEALDTLKNLAVRLISSRVIKTALWPCIGRALYNNQRITLETFEVESARADYLIVLKEVLWFNLSPFTKNLKSLFSGIQQSNTPIQG